MTGMLSTGTASESEFALPCDWIILIPVFDASAATASCEVAVVVAVPVAANQPLQARAFGGIAALSENEVGVVNVPLLSYQISF